MAGAVTFNKAATTGWPAWRVPVGGSLLLHALIVAAFALNLPFCTHEVKLPPVPRHVTAVVVEKSAPRAAPVVERVAEPVARPEPVPQPVAKPEPKPAPKPAAKPQPKKPEPKKPEPAKPVPKPVAKAAPKPVEKPKPVLPPTDFAALAAAEDKAAASQAKAQQAAQAQASAQSAAQAAAEAGEVEEYRLLILAEVMKRWSRPPSARRGMETVLSVNLIPGGEVIAVQLVKSSGDAAFDRSAENAIRLAGRLPVPTDPQLFNRHFRKFTFKFRPEDLKQ